MQAFEDETTIGTLERVLRANRLRIDYARQQGQLWIVQVSSQARRVREGGRLVSTTRGAGRTLAAALDAAIASWREAHNPPEPDLSPEEIRFSRE